jgi:hypothetical protein
VGRLGGRRGCLRSGRLGLGSSTLGNISVEVVWRAEELHTMLGLLGRVETNRILWLHLSDELRICGINNGGRSMLSCVVLTIDR